jgi:hypothetical protein
MGCGCKQQPQEPVVPKGITPLVIQAVAQPAEITYTIEDLIKVKDYISSTNKSETDRQSVANFMFEKEGFIVPSYCDQICLSNLRVKVAEMESRLK